MLFTVVLCYLLCHALFPSCTSVMSAIISLPWVKESLGACSHLPEHSNLFFTSKRSLQLQPHQHKKRPWLWSLPFIHWSTSKMPELKCASAWESDLFEAFIRLVTLLWLIYSVPVEQNITLTAEAQFSYLRTMRVPQQWWMRFIFFRRLASGALFLGLLPCQTWKQEWNHLKLPLVDCYCSSAFLHSTVTQMLEMFEWWLQTKYIVL